MAEYNGPPLFPNPSEAPDPTLFEAPAKNSMPVNVSDQQSRTTATLAALPAIVDGQAEADKLIEQNHLTIQDGKEATLRIDAANQMKQDQLDSLRAMQSQVMKTGPVMADGQKFSLIDFMKGEQSVDAQEPDQTALESRGVNTLASWTGLDKDQDAMLLHMGSEHDQAVRTNTKLQIYNRTVDELHTKDVNRPWYEKGIDAVTDFITPTEFLSKLYAVPGKGSILKSPARNWNDQIDAIWDHQLSPQAFKAQLDKTVASETNSLGVHTALSVVQSLGSPIGKQDALGYNVFSYAGPAAYLPVLKIAKMVKYASGAARVVGNRALSSEIVAAGLEGKVQGKTNPLGEFQPHEVSIAESLPSVVIPDTLDLARVDVGVSGDVADKIANIREATQRVRDRLAKGERIDPSQLMPKIKEELERVQTEYKDNPVADIKRDEIPATAPEPGVMEGLYSDIRPAKTKDFVTTGSGKRNPKPKPYTPHVQTQADLDEMDSETLAMLNDHGELRPVKVDGAPAQRTNGKKAVLKNVGQTKYKFEVDDDTDLDNISHFNARGEIYHDVPDAKTARNNPFVDAMEGVQFADNGVHPLGSEDLDVAKSSGKDFRVARRYPDGTIKTGKPGDTHGDLLDEGDTIESMSNGHMGFVDKSGKFYTREEAAKAIGRPGSLNHSELKDIQSGRTAEVEKQIAELSHEVQVRDLNNGLTDKERELALKSGLKPEVYLRDLNRYGGPETKGEIGGLRGVPTLQRTKETGLYSLKFFVGKDNGGGFITREGAEAAASRKGLDPRLIDIHQTVDGHWFVGVTHPIPETGMALPQLSKDAFPNIFKESQYVKSLDSLMPEIWNEARLTGVLNQARFMSGVVKPWVKQIKRLNGPQTKTLSTILGLSERERTWYNVEELHQKYINVTGKYPTQKEVMAYYSAKELSDLNYHIFNHNLYIAKARKGLETVSMKNAEIGFDTGRTNGRLITREEAGGQRLFHLEDGAWSNGIDKDTQVLLDTGHYKIVELENSKQVIYKNEPVKYVVAHQDSMTHGPLEYQQLPYVAGGSRENAYRWFGKQAVHGTFADGSRYWLDPITHIAAPTKKSADKWTSAMEAARQAYINPEMSMTEKRMFIERSPAESYDKFDQMVKDGKIRADTPFETLFDRQQADYMNKHVQAERDLDWSDPSRSGKENYYISKGRMYYSEKGEHLRDPDGNYAKVLDPLTTLHKAVLNASRTNALADYNTKVVEEWARLATPFLEKKSYGIGGDPWDKFFNGRMRSEGLSDTDKAFLTNLDVSRNAHKRFMNMRDPADLATWRAGKALGQWLENRGSVFGDRLAEGVYNHLSDDPVSALRSLVFQSFFGFGNLGRFVLHATQSFSAVAVHPVYGMKAFAASPFTWFATAVNRSDNVLDYIARKLGPEMGMKVEDYKHMVQSLRYSGWMDVGGEMAQLDRYWNSWGGNKLSKLWDATKDIGTMPFHAGIKVQRLTAYQIAWQVAREEMPDVLYSTEQFQNFVNRYADRMSGNMTTSSQAYWQKGPLSIPTTYLSWQARQLENMLPKAMGGSPHWTAMQRARLNLGAALLYGSAGVPGARMVYDAIADQYRAHTGQQIDADTQRTFTRGMLDTLLHNVTGNETDFAHRAGVGEAFESLWNSISSGEWNSFLGTVEGPLFETGSRGFDALSRLSHYMRAEQTDGMTKEQFAYAIQDVLPIVQGFRYDLQSYWAFKYGYIKDMKTGQKILDPEDPDWHSRPAAITEALGIPMVQETAWGRYLRSEKDREQDINQMAQAVAKVRRGAFEQFYQDHDEKAFERNLGVVRVLMQPFRDDPLMSGQIAQRANDLMSHGHTTSEWQQTIMREERSTGLKPAEANKEQQ